MELHAAEQLALRLMREFGLMASDEEMQAVLDHGIKTLRQFNRVQNNWRFEFDNARRRFGCCHRRDKKITLSREIVRRNDQKEVEDTIRHEIAHALCPPRCGHGAEWERMCLKTGANPKRCYDSEVVDAPKGDWRATCGACGTEHTKFRRTRRELYCAAPECLRKNGRRTPEQKLMWRHKNARFDPTAYATQVLGVQAISAAHLTVTTEAKRAGVEYIKEQLRKEREMQQMNGS